ncbi:MAG: hypothetical protein ABIH92_02460 [Nanoarchaeota archaeon]
MEKTLRLLKNSANSALLSVVLAGALTASSCVGTNGVSVKPDRTEQTRAQETTQLQDSPSPSKPEWYVKPIIYHSDYTKSLIHVRQEHLPATYAQDALIYRQLLEKKSRGGELSDLEVIFLGRIRSTYSPGRMTHLNNVQRNIGHFLESLSRRGLLKEVYIEGVEQGKTFVGGSFRKDLHQNLAFLQVLTGYNPDDPESFRPFLDRYGYTIGGALINSSSNGSPTLVGVEPRDVLAVIQEYSKTGDARDITDYRERSIVDYVLSCGGDSRGKVLVMGAGHDFSDEVARYNSRVSLEDRHNFVEVTPRGLD